MSIGLAGCLLLAPAVPAATISSGLGTGSFLVLPNSGNMFNVANLSADDIETLGTFRLEDALTSLGAFRWYYREGTFAGHQTNAAGWTLLGAASATGKGLLNPTPVDFGATLVIPAGATYSFFLLGIDGTALIPLKSSTSAVSDGTLKLTFGAGVGGASSANPFVTVSRKQGWYGAFDYQVAPTQAPEPGTFVLLGLGLAGLAFLRRRRTAGIRANPRAGV